MLMNWEGEQILSTNQDFHSQLGPAWTTPSQGRRGVSAGTVSQTVLTPHSSHLHWPQWPHWPPDPTLSICE